MFDGFEMFDFRWHQISKDGILIKMILKRALGHAQTENMLSDKL